MRSILLLAAATTVAVGVLAQADEVDARHADKMMAAKTPEERQAPMADHMKAMKDGMGVMGQMKGGRSSMGMGAKDGMEGMEGMEGMLGHRDMMSKRMGLMELMMDREAARSAPVK